MENACDSIVLILTHKPERSVLSCCIFALINATSGSGTEMRALYFALIPGESWHGNNDRA